MPRRATRPVKNRVEEIKRELSPSPRTVDEKLDETADLDSEDPLTKRMSGQP